MVTIKSFDEPYPWKIVREQLAFERQLRKSMSSPALSMSRTVVARELQRLTREAEARQRFALPAISEVPRLVASSALRSALVELAVRPPALAQVRSWTAQRQQLLSSLSLLERMQAPGLSVPALEESRRFLEEIDEAAVAELEEVEAAEPTDEELARAQALIDELAPAVEGTMPPAAMRTTVVYLGMAIALSLYLQAFFAIPGFVFVAGLLGAGALDAARYGGKAVEIVWDRLYPPADEEDEGER